MQLKPGDVALDERIDGVGLAEERFGPPAVQCRSADERVGERAGLPSLASPRWPVEDDLLLPFERLDVAGAVPIASAAGLPYAAQRRVVEVQQSVVRVAVGQVAL